MDGSFYNDIWLDGIIDNVNSITVSPALRCCNTKKRCANTDVYITFMEEYISTFASLNK